MRLAISNIAWKPREREAVYAVLADHGVRGLEIAPAMACPDETDPFIPSNAAASRFMRSLECSGLELVSMQSLLFGVQDARLFGSEAQRERFEAALARAVTLAGRLSIPNLVMGSPANRTIPNAMSRTDAERLALNVFRRIGDLCVRARTNIALEPNAAAYGTNFLTTIGETVAFAQSVAHPAVSVNFDIGSLHMNGETGTVGYWLDKARPLVSYIHVSEPHLAPAPRDAELFKALASEILAQGYTGWFSIEMRPTGEDNLASVRTAINTCAHALTAAARRRSSVRG